MKKIHQIWLQGASSLPEKYKEYSESYQKLNPEWEYKLWDLKSIRELIEKDYPELLSIWENYEFWVMRVDLGKYCILNTHGGLLIDMDTKPIKPFDPSFLLCDKAMVLEHTNTWWHRLIGINRTTNNNFLYIPYPNHPLSVKLVKRAKCTFRRMPWEFKFFHVLGSIGPLFMIETIDTLPKKDVEWYPASEAFEYFEDEAANSWNKSLMDEQHDRKWGLFFLILVILVVIALWSTSRRNSR